MTGAGARPLAVGLGGWLLVLVALLVLLGGAGGAALLLGDAHHETSTRLDDLARTSTALVVAASDTGAGRGAGAQRDAVASLSAQLEALAVTDGERSAVQREVTAAREWVELGPRPAGGAPGEAAGGAAAGASPGALLAAHDALVRRVSGDQSVLRAQQAQLRDTSLTLVGLVLAVALALTLLLAVRVRRGLVDPLADVASVLGALTSGDHARRADARRGPAEVRAVAGWVNALADEGARARAAAERSADLRRLASEAGRLARDPVDPEASLGEALRALGEGLGVDRVWVRLVDPDDGAPWESRRTTGSARPDPAMGALRGSWAREGAPAVVEDVGDAARGVPAWLQEAWSQDGHLAVDDLPALLAAGGAPVAARDFAERTGATAVLVVPVGAGEAAVGALTAFTHDGPRAWTEEEVGLLRSVASDLGRAVVVNRLLAGSEALVEQLRELDVRKSTFLATVSHELRTPLTSIAGYVEMLRDGGAGELDEDVDRMLAVVERNTVRLRVLIEDLLALSHIEDGAPRGVLELVAVGGLARGVVEEHRTAAAGAGVLLEVDVDLDAELVGALGVRGDAASLHRAVSGLVSNAVKFTPAGGSVLVRAARDGERCAVEVVDTGIGIPLAEQGGLFTRFFRASNATELAVPGAGLGLTIARSVVEHHGGQLLIASAPGTGTTARVLLPAAAAAEVAPAGL